MLHDKNKGKLYQVPDLFNPVDNVSNSARRIRKRMALMDTVKGRNKKRPMKSQRKMLEKAGMVSKDARGQYSWTMEGKRALNLAIGEERAEAAEKGLPWPPYPEYFKDMRDL